jgi:RHS repeat-associated protein
LVAVLAAAAALGGGRPGSADRRASASHAIGVVLDNPTGTIARDQCLTIATGRNAAYECGDLRLVHALPGARTRGTARAPTLLYNSQHAHPFPVVGASVTFPALPPGAIRLVVTASLSVNGQVVATASYPGGFSPGLPYRLALTFDGTNLATGVYPATLSVSDVVFGGVPSFGQASGEIAVVNRKDSPFGAGWWLAGYERILAQPDGSLFCDGGDGSTRHYTDRRIVGGSRAYVAESVERPDTIVLTGSVYQRKLAGGIVTRFDARGFHDATIAPGNITTSFAIDGADRLSTITLPNLGTPYTFSYDGNGKLATVAAPNAGVSRTTTVTVASGRLTSITDPDTRVVQFGYSPVVGFENVIADRTNRRAVPQLFVYDSTHRLRQSKLGLSAAAADTMRTTFCAAETQGSLASSCAAIVPAAFVRTFVDGPRTDSTDVTSFVIDRFGAPTLVVDAQGAGTLLERGDARFPALVTRLIRPNGLETHAGYDARGNIVADTAINPLGTGQNAVTRYEWDARWDKPTKITTPTGDFTEFAYDATTGVRLWAQSSRAGADTTYFRYYAAGAATALPRAVQHPTIAGGTVDADSIEYDALGNAAIVRTMGGATTLHIARTTSDAIGRTTAQCVDVVLNGAQHCTRTTYDAMDRDSIVIERGDAVGATPAESVVVRAFYDGEGNLTRSERTPSGGTIGTIVGQATFDVANRRTSQIHPDGAVERFGYDLASNVIADTTRRVDPFAGVRIVTQTFDAMNRLTQRTVPSVTYRDTLAGIGAADFQPYPRRPNGGSFYVIAQDVETFTYDSLGQVRTANNGDAHVTRTYFPSGALKTERQELRDAGSATFSHSYLLQYSYDLSGKRTAVKLPSQLVPAGTRDSIATTYDALTGELQSIVDPLGNAFTYAYTTRGEPTTLTFPGSYQQRWTYFADGLLSRDKVVNLGGTAGGRAPLDTLRSTAFTYDAAQQRLTADDPFGFQEVQRFAYSGLGHLTSSYMKQFATMFVPGGSLPAQFSTGEQPTYDGIANILSTTTVDTLRLNGVPAERSRRVSTSTYQTGVGRLLSELSAQGGKTYRYDPAGNLEFTMRQPSGGTPAPSEDRFSYYAADGRVRAADYRFRANGLADDTYRKWVFEQYRYDALGRRVWVRTDRDCQPPSNGLLSSPEWLECNLSTLRRTIWDGERELIEIQVPLRLPQAGQDQPASVLEDDLYLPQLPHFNFQDPNPFFGRVLFVHGLDVDRPIAITRYNYVDFFQTPVTNVKVNFPPTTFSLFWNAQGKMALALCANGQRECSATSGGRTANMGLDIPENWFAYERPRFIARFFQGTLLRDKEDATRTFYRRNRYYDPGSGRFTQEDPIGLAGGLNLYGFASGDPVDYADPFGLLDCNKKTGEGCSEEYKRLLKEDKPLETPLIDPVEIAVDVATGGAAGLARAGAHAAEERVVRRLTRWGWEGSAKHRAAIRELAQESRKALTHETVGGLVPTAAEAEQLIVRGGGRVLRVEQHAPGGVSTHTYPHINYVTKGGTKSTIRVQSIDP